MKEEVIKYRILQKNTKYYIQEYSKEGFIFKTYGWRNLGETIGIKKPIFFTNYYNTFEEAKARIDMWIKINEGKASEHRVKEVKL